LQVQFLKFVSYTTNAHFEFNNSFVDLKFQQPVSVLRFYILYFTLHKLQFFHRRPTTMVL